MKFYLIINLIIFIHHLKIINGQGLQQLSYANAEIGEKLIRPTSTTTLPPSTSEKASFFSGIRNIFSRKTTTTVAPTPTPTIATNHNQPSVIRGGGSGALVGGTTPKPFVQNLPHSSTPQNVNTILSASTTTKSPYNIPLSTSSTTVTKPFVPPSSSSSSSSSSQSLSTTNFNVIRSTAKPIKEDFPALPPSRGSINSLPTPPTPSSTVNQVWSNMQFSTTRKPAQPMVSFVKEKPNGPSTGRPSSTASSSITLLATNSEIETLTEALFTKDTNNPSRLISVDYQGRTQSSATTDEAPKPLITADVASLDAIPTISKLRVLYNNYELDTTVNEHVTPNERREENEFVDAVLGTSLMRHMMLFLSDKELVTKDPKTHRDLLKTIWFNLYSRGRGRIGSSAFEHVFLTEIKNGTVSGLHNWIYFNEEEKAGHADYKGYIKKLDLGTKGAIVKYRFTYNNINKPVNGMFVGTSPELEMALYTLCFELRPDKECPVSLGGNKFIIRTHTFRYRGKNLIGSAFPEI